MIGNDIIDISKTKRVSDWRRPGFLEKIFSAKEQALISESADPFITVWQLWSMKESAYKVFIQAGGQRFFNPSKIECNLHSTEIGEVSIDGMVLKTNTLFQSDYIFSTSTLENVIVETEIFQLSEGDQKNQSDFMRLQVIESFAKKHSLNRKDLRIVKTEVGVPKIYYGSEQLDISLSITHHGRFGGYSLQMC